MTDKELLELAGKAADIPKRVIDAAGGMYNCDERGWHRNWNPLNDDGDALRLAVKLNLLILPYPNDNAVRVTRLDQPDTIVSYGTPPDPDDATRRAIVRAAAEIGKAMP